MNEVKVEKLPVIASRTWNFISKLLTLKGAKIWWVFSQLYKNSTAYFVLQVLTLGVDFKIESALQARRKKVKFYI